MSSGSRSPSEKRERSNSKDKGDNNKLYITNLDGQVPSPLTQTDIKLLESELRKMLEEYGEIESLSAKRNKTS